MPSVEQRSTISELGSEELRSTLEQHRLWVESRGEKGKRACLANTDLQGVDLRNAQLEEADLRNSVLIGAKLTGCNFNNAILSGADLRDAQGLTLPNLSGAKLSGANLPKYIDFKQELERIAEISKHARLNFLALLGVCFYSWLVIAATSDASLIVNSLLIALPIIQTKTSVSNFYLFFPIIMISLYIYLHIYLRKLWEALKDLPSTFADGRESVQVAFPWLLSEIAHAHLPLLKKPNSLFFQLQYVLSFCAAWIFAPFTIFALWLRYLPRHDDNGTILLSAYVTALAWFGVQSFELMLRTLGGRQSRCTAIQTSLHLAPIMIVLSVTLFGWYASEFLSLENGAVRHLLYADLRRADLGVQAREGYRKVADQKLVLGPDLENVDLRFADAKQAYLAGAFIWHSNLSKADLSRAVLSEANLTDSDLSHARLVNADLTKAVLENTKFHCADLTGANLRDARIEGAEFQGADLSMAKEVDRDAFKNSLCDNNTKSPVAWGVKSIDDKICEKDKMTTDCGKRD